MGVKENIKNIRERIINSAQRVGRNPEDITLLGVSKKIQPRLMIEAYSVGLMNFGENYAQEFRDKYASLHEQLKNAKWHYIGHLQKNKIKYLIGKVDLIHSVDSFGLVEEINRRSAAQEITTDILIEINSGGEETKTGMGYEDAKHLISRLNEFESINFKGLMTMTPYFDDPEKARPYFRDIKSFSNDIIKDNPGASDISMGMSQDFEIAIEEGSTIVRIGTAVFGPRES